MSRAFVARVPPSCMSYEENLARMHFKCSEVRTSKTDMHQLYLDGHPIGSVVTPEKREALFYWLGTAIPDLENVFRPDPPWLSGQAKPKRKSRRKSKIRK